MAQQQSSAVDAPLQKSIGKKSDSQQISYTVMQNYLFKVMRETRQLHNHPAMVVEPFLLYHERTVRHYRVKRVVSPYDFILEYVYDGQNTKWFDQMQQFYENKENQELVKLNGHDRLQPNGCYVCKSPVDSKWHRVRVHAVHESKDTVELFFIDLCMMAERKVMDLVKMNPLYAQMPATLSRCYLYDIAPNHAKVPANTVVKGPWSQQACEYFQDAVIRKDQIYQGIVFTRSDELVTKGIYDVYQNMGVVLMEKLPNQEGPVDVKKVPCTVNAQMVDAGYAFATGIFGCCQHSTKIDGVLIPAFNKAEFDQLFPPGPESPKPIPNLIVTREDMKKLWPSYTDEDLDKHPPPFPFRSHNWYDQNKILEKLPKQFADNLCQVKLIYAHGPSLMIVHQTRQIPALMEMHNCLERQVKKEEPLDLKEIRSGLFAACLILDTTSGDIKIWCRTIVKGKAKNLPGIYKVVMIDYGNEVGVLPANMRKLPEYFLNIPSFAIRIHLDAPWCIPKDGAGWSTEASSFFCDKVFREEKEEPPYYIHRPATASTIPLEDYRQDVCYNASQSKWVPATSPVDTGKKVAHLMRSLPIFNSLYVSHGVDLFYEVVVKTSNCWHFRSIAGDFSYETRFAQRDEAKWLLDGPNSKKKIHLEIFYKTLETPDRKSVEGDVNVTPRIPEIVQNQKAAYPSIRKEKVNNLLKKAFIDNKIIPEDQ